VRLGMYLQERPLGMLSGVSLTRPGSTTYISAPRVKRVARWPPPDSATAML
jgi:hypothetical protein